MAMKELDLLIKNAKIVTADTTFSGQIGSRDGKIVYIGAAGEEAPAAAKTVDISGKYLLPGAIDPHCHFQDPGFTQREDFEHGTMAAAAGGMTTVLSHPLDNPPQTTFENLRVKEEAYEGNAYVDYGIHVGATADNLDLIPRLWKETGATAVKMFMCFSVKEFPFVDDLAMITALKQIASVDGLAIIHAESDGILKEAEAQVKKTGKCDGMAYNRTHPKEAEIEAITRALYFLEITSCSGVILHVSTAEGLRLIRAAKERGVKVYAESAPHLFQFVDEDMKEKGPFLKFSPVMHDRENQKEMWDLIGKGYVDYIGSDHSPYTYEEKMPNETEAHTIFDTYDVKMTQNENFVRLVQEGKETPIERYAGILDNVYYSTETGTGFDSASRKKIVDEVQSYDQEITLDDAQKSIQNIQNHNGLPFLFSNGEMGSLTGKINFLAAVEEKNTQISFSSVLGSDGKETVHYVSYYEEKSLDLDHPTSYDYDFTLVIENGKISEATLTGMAAATDNWDLDKHEPKEGTGTFMSFHLENVTYVDALPQTGTAPLLSTLPSYFITEIKHASFQDYMTGKDAVIRVGDSYFTSLLKIDSYEPSTALDVSTITITSSSDESVIGKDSYGYGYEALKAGTTDLTLGNVFNPNLYTMKGVTVLPAEPSVTGIKGVYRVSHSHVLNQKAVAEFVEFPVDGDSECLKREGGSGRTFASAFAVESAQNVVADAGQVTAGEERFGFAEFDDAAGEAARLPDFAVVAEYGSKILF